MSKAYDKIAAGLRDAMALAIPAGPYCYASLSEMDERGHMKINGKCPYWESRPGENAYCRFLDYETEFERELLWDQVKVCGVKDDPQTNWERK